MAIHRRIAVTISALGRDLLRRAACRPFIGRHVKGLLGAGIAIVITVVIGFGSTETLASWVDRENARGTFTASAFVTESSVNSAAYVSNTASPGGTVTLAAAGFLPATSQFFPVLIRTKATSVAGTVTLQAAALTGTDAATLGAAFRYRVVQTTGSCALTSFTMGSPTWIVGDATTQQPLATASTVAVSLGAAGASTPGTAIGFCFQVTLPAGADNSLQNKTATATWQFREVSS
ncbi:hypothetical protein BH09ACT1_BH09ACT1_26440 [soil metagenome]